MSTIGPLSAAVAVLLLAGCAGEDTQGVPPPSPPPPILPDPRLNLLPPTVGLELADTFRFVVDAHNVDTSGGYRWRSLDTSIAFIDQSGLVAARALGRTHIVVTLQSDSTLSAGSEVVVR